MHFTNFEVSEARGHRCQFRRDWFGFYDPFVAVNTRLPLAHGFTRIPVIADIRDPTTAAAIFYDVNLAVASDSYDIKVGTTYDINAAGNIYDAFVAVN